MSDEGQGARSGRFYLSCPLPLTPYYYFQPTMRTLAIDPGTRRIGLAMSDEGGQWASPLEVLMVTDPDQAIEPILKLIAKEAVVRVVIGLPLNMDDSVGPQARSVVAWANKLQTSLHAARGTQHAPKIVFVDERLSSFVAEQRLIDVKRAGGKMTRKDKKQSLDAVAAAGILQSFLDGKLLAIEVPSFHSTTPNDAG